MRNFSLKFWNLLCQLLVQFLFVGYITLGLCQLFNEKQFPKAEGIALLTNLIFFTVIKLFLLMDLDTDMKDDSWRGVGKTFLVIVKIIMLFAIVSLVYPVVALFYGSFSMPEIQPKFVDIGLMSGIFLPVIMNLRIGTVFTKRKQLTN